MGKTTAGSFKALVEQMKRERPEEWAEAEKWAKEKIATGEWREMFCLMEKARNEAK